MKNTLLQKIKNNTAIVGVVGLGYVGLPVAYAFAKGGLQVIGFDINETYIGQLNAKESYIPAVTNEQLMSIIDAKLFSATLNFSKLTNCDIIIVCVPTPLSACHIPDMSYVEKSTISIAQYLRKGQAISYESTVYPGATEEIVLPILEKTQLKAGKDFFLLYSPERENPGTEEWNIHNIPKIVSGFTESCREIAIAVYGKAIQTVVPVSSLKVAESIKLWENIYRCINISAVNEMKIIMDKMGINVHEVIDGAATKPFGFQKFTPGPGIGGHCIPVDPFYLTYKAKEFGIHARFIELAGEINFKIQKFVVDKVTFGLNRVKKSTNGSKILAIGLAYKENVSDLRESPSIHIIEQLTNLGAIVDYHDSFVPNIYSDNLSKKMFGSVKTNIDLTAQNIAQYDVVVILTKHKTVDYDLLLQNAQLIVDAKNVYPNDMSDKIICA